MFSHATFVLFTGRKLVYYVLRSSEGSESKPTSVCDEDRGSQVTVEEKEGTQVPKERSDNVRDERREKVYSPITDSIGETADRPKMNISEQIQKEIEQMTMKFGKVDFNLETKITSTVDFSETNKFTGTVLKRKYAKV